MFYIFIIHWVTHYLQLYRMSHHHVFPFPPLFPLFISRVCRGAVNVLVKYVLFAENMLLSMFPNRFHLVCQMKHWVAATGLENPWHRGFGQNITCLGMRSMIQIHGLHTHQTCHPLSMFGMLWIDV
jgi:hypothetical protein